MIRKTALGLLAAATMAVTVLGAGTATADPVANPGKDATVSERSTTAPLAARNGVCEAGEICFYYLSNLSGSVSDFTGSLANYGTSQPTCYEFKGAGAGQGQCMKNNARSAWNRSSRNVRVYFNSNYGGASDLVPAGTWRNLNVTYDDNASHRFL